MSRSPVAHPGDANVEGFGCRPGTHDEATPRTPKQGPASESLQWTKPRWLGVRYGDLRAADDTPARREGDGGYGPTPQRCMREWIWTRCTVSDEDSCAICDDSEGIRRAEVLPVENQCKERTKWRRDLGALVMMCRS
jgi:hypothetical protein